MLFNLNKIFMGVFLILLLIVLLLCCCGTIWGFCADIYVLRTVCRFPFCCFSVVLMLLLLALAGFLIFVWKTGDSMVVEICKDDDGSATKENFIKVNSILRSFSTGVYETMDEYYCTDYCPCKANATTF